MQVDLRFETFHTRNSKLASENSMELPDYLPYTSILEDAHSGIAIVSLFTFNPLKEGYKFKASCYVFVCGLVVLCGYL